MKNRLLLFGMCVLLLLGSCQNDQGADIIFYNGSIVAMTGQEVIYEAIAIKDGKILDLGSSADMQHYAQGNTQQKDLGGNSILPGFIDAHSHFSLAMQSIDWANLSSPPVSTIASIDDMVSTLSEHEDIMNLMPGDWLVGWGYDPDLIFDQRHPTKHDLDEAFPDRPVFLVHVSGHLGVVNSAALRLLGWTAETPNPQGGQIMRMPNSNEPSGLLAESAMHIVRETLPKADLTAQSDKALRTFELYARNGITTANDGFSTKENIDVLEHIADTIDFPLDVISLVGFNEFKEIMESYDIAFEQYDNRLKYAGVKIVADGSPQGKTALMTDPYLTEVPGCAHDCRGIAVVQQEQLDAMLTQFYGMGIQVYTHCNGDAAIDMYLNAHDQAVKAQELESRDLRSVIIHSQFMRQDLIEQYAHYGLIPSYFTNHTFYWGDTHMRNMGEERAFFTSPLVASDDAGILYTNHTDYPITPLDQLFLTWSAVSRESRSGEIIGSDQRTSIYNALQAITINAAYQYKEENMKGTLEPGKLADLVVLSSNPLDANSTNLKKIEIVSTYKEGILIYQKG